MLRRVLICLSDCVACLALVCRISFDDGVLAYHEWLDICNEVSSLIEPVEYACSWRSAAYDYEILIASHCWRREDNRDICAFFRHRLALVLVKHGICVHGDGRVDFKR